MTIFKCWSVSLAIVIAAAGCGGHRIERKDGHWPIKDLDKEVSDQSVFNGLYGWPQVFEEICKKHLIPCGVEESPDDPFSGGGDEPLAFKETSVSIRQVLDRIVARHPSYQWKFCDGVLNIQPARGKEYQRDGTGLMNQKIVDFAVRNTTPFLAVRGICEHVGILRVDDTQEIVKIGGLIRDNAGPPSLVNLDFRDVTVREALNRVAKSDPQIGFWKIYVNRNGKDGEYVVEYAVTRS